MGGRVRRKMEQVVHLASLNRVTNVRLQGAPRWDRMFVLVDET